MTRQWHSERLWAQKVTSVGACESSYRNGGLVGSSGKGVEVLTYLERAKSRAFLERLALTSLPIPMGTAHPLFDQERQLVRRLKGLIASQQIEGQIDSEKDKMIQEAEEELRPIWDKLEAAAPEYVALRRGRPAAFEELRSCLQNV